jgi:hypothetical protein
MCAVKDCKLSLTTQRILFQVIFQYLQIVITSTLIHFSILIRFVKSHDLFAPRHTWRYLQTVCLTGVFRGV